MVRALGHGPQQKGLTALKHFCIKQQQLWRTGRKDFAGSGGYRNA